MAPPVPPRFAYEYEVVEETRGGRTTQTPGSVEVQSDKSFGRALSWLRLGSNDAAAQDKGLVVGPEGQITSSRSEGYGILEKLWVWLRGWFWTISLGLLLLFGLSFAPVVGPICQGILRAIGSLIPVVGSATENIIGRVKSSRVQAQYQQPIREIIAGGDEFEKILNTSSLAPEAKKQVWEMYTTAQKTKQSVETQKTYREL